MSNGEEEYFKVLDEIEQDGYIIIDTRIMVEYQASTLGDPRSEWREEMDTQKFMYGETEGMAIDATGIRINLRSDETGARDMLFWPWSSVIHYTHRTNSKEISARVAAAWEDYEKTKYAEQGIEQLEHALSGEGPHGPNCHCNDDSDVDGYPVNTDSPNPCNPEHHVAIMTKADIWTCLECASQWDDDGEIID